MRGNPRAVTKGNLVLVRQGCSLVWVAMIYIGPAMTVEGYDTLYVNTPRRGTTMHFLELLIREGEIPDYDIDGDMVRVFFEEGTSPKKGIVVSKYSLLDALVREGIIGAYETLENGTTFVRGMPEDYVASNTGHEYEGGVTWGVTLDAHGEVIDA